MHLEHENFKEVLAAPKQARTFVNNRGDFRGRGRGGRGRGGRNGHQPESDELVFDRRPKEEFG